MSWQMDLWFCTFYKKYWIFAPIGPTVKIQVLTTLCKHGKGRGRREGWVGCEREGVWERERHSSWSSVREWEHVRERGRKRERMWAREGFNVIQRLFYISNNVLNLFIIYQKRSFSIGWILIFLLQERVVLSNQKLPWLFYRQ